MAISAAVDGLGVCLDSTLLAMGELGTGRLVKPLGNDGIEIQAHRLVCLPKKKDLPKIVAFKTWLKSALFEDAPLSRSEQAPPAGGPAAYELAEELK